MIIMEKESCLNQVVYPLSKKNEIVQIIVLSIFIFLVPMIIPQVLTTVFGINSPIASNSQYVVGTIVNTVLITVGLNVKGWKQIVGLITLPSISAMSSGLIFKTANIYSVYMIPAIWLGNFAFIYLYRKLAVQKNLNYILTSIISILTKASIIYLGFRIFTIATIIPNAGKIFTALNFSMGINQIITASIAAVIGFGISKYFNYKTSKKEV